MAKAVVTELGYVGIGVQDVEAWRLFATEVLGLESFEEKGRTMLRVDQWHSRIAMYPEGDDDLAYAGFRVAGPEEFRDMQQHLSDCGVAYDVASSAEAEDRSVLEFLRLHDPAGIPLEIFHGPLVDRHKPFRPGRGMHGKFCTGSGGLGHIILRDAAGGASYRFYSQVLGMRGNVENRIHAPSGVFEATFMHCNERDHTVAFGVGPLEKKIHHLMLEVDNIDDVGLAYDLVRKRGMKILVTLGRHSNDNTISFYVQTPSGWYLEYGYAGAPATHQSEYSVNEVWGHEFSGEP